MKHWFSLYYRLFALFTLQKGQASKQQKKKKKNAPGAISDNAPLFFVCWHNYFSGVHSTRLTYEHEQQVTGYSLTFTLVRSRKEQSVKLLVIYFGTSAKALYGRQMGPFHAHTQTDVHFIPHEQQSFVIDW